MGYELRDYQRRMVDAVLSWFCDEGNKGKAVCLVAPTGSGKTALSAAITEEVGGKALLLTHTKELIEQDGEAMAFHSPKRSVGYYSASIGRKDLSCDTTCAGIASMYRCKDLPSFDLVLIDEAHLINNRDEGMYRQLLSRIWEVNPNAWIAGLTATPYRLGQGMLTDDGFFSDIIDVVSVRELQDKGYLAHLTSKWTETHYDFSKLRVRGGEFRDDDVQKAVSVFKTNEQVADEIVRRGEDRNAWLVFCAGVAHAETMCTLLNERGIPTACVTGETPKTERERILEAYKAGEYRCLTNMRILTTGFNYPDIDMVALLAPTLSPGLYCLDLETEILTDKGWTTHNDINKASFAYSYDMQTGKIEKSPILGSIERDVSINEQFITFNGQLLKFRVTDQHRMIFHTKNAPVQIKTAMEMASYKAGVWVPVSGHMDFPGLPLSDDEIRFIAWVMTDGWINKKNHAVSITQKHNTKNSTEIRRVLESCNLRYGLYVVKGSTQFVEYREQDIYTISFGMPRRLSERNGKTGWAKYEEYISKDFKPCLHQMSNHQFEVFIETCDRADGPHNKTLNYTRRTTSFVKGNKSFMDNIQIAAILRGYRANISMTTAGRKNPLYKINLKKQEWNFIGSVYDTHSIIQKENPSISERCWCIETQKGTIITRYKGTPLIMGNCQEIGRGLRLKSDRDRTCLVLDFAGNVLRHGPVDDIQPPAAKVKGNGVAPCKVCPVCSEIVHASARICPSCGHEFPQKDKTWLLDGTVEVEKTEERKEKYYTTYVGAWRWDVYTTKNGRQCLRVRYFSLSKADRHISEMFFIWNNVSVARRNEDVIRLSSIFQEMGYQGDNDLGMMLRVLNVTRPPVKVLWKNEKGYPVLVKRFWGAAA